MKVKELHVKMLMGDSSEFLLSVLFVQMKSSEGKRVSYCMYWIYYNESTDHVKYQC